MHTRAKVVAYLRTLNANTIYLKISFGVFTNIVAINLRARVARKCNKICGKKTCRDCDAFVPQYVCIYVYMQIYCLQFSLLLFSVAIPGFVGRSRANYSY